MANIPVKVKQTSVSLITVVLWVLAAGLGIIAIFFLKELAVLLYVFAVGRDYYAGVLAGQIVTVIAGLVWVMVIIGSGEYVFKHPGQRKSWIILAWLLGVELIIILLGILLT